MANGFNIDDLEGTGRQNRRFSQPNTLSGGDRSIAQTSRQPSISQAPQPVQAPRPVQSQSLSASQARLPSQRQVPRPTQPVQPIQPPVQQSLAQPTAVSRRGQEQQIQDQQQQDSLTDFGSIQEQSLADLQRRALGDSEALDLLEERYLGSQAAASAARKAASQQQALQRGADPTLLRTLGLQSDRAGETAQGQIRADLAVERARQAEQAQRELLDVSTRLNDQQKQEVQNQILQLQQAGGADNLAQATKLFNKLNGIDIDYHGLEQKGIGSILGSYAAIPGIDINRAIQMAQESGDLEFLGLSPEEARRYIEPIMQSSNPIAKVEAEAKAMLDAGQITQDQYENMLLVAQQKATGTEGFDISQGFIVSDEAGRRIGQFKSQEEVDAFMAQNQGKNYNVSEGKVIFKEGEHTPFTGKNVGDVFEKNGTLYTIADNGEQVRAKFNKDDPFSNISSKMLDAYGVNDIENPKDFPKGAKKILDAQKSFLINRPNQWPSEVDPDSALYKSVLAQVGDNHEFKMRESRKDKRTYKIPLFADTPEGSLIGIGGRVYQLVHSSVNDEFFDKGSRYVIQDKITGDRTTVTIDEDGKINIS
jgi:hypothetical protein